MDNKRMPKKVHTKHKNCNQIFKNRQNENKQKMWEKNENQKQSAIEK